MPEKTQYRLINITDKVYEDPELKAYVDEKEAPLLPLRNTIAGTARGSFDNTFRTTPWDSALGDAICDALAESGKKYGTELSFENRGGIRARIEQGPVSLEEIQEVLPFDNHAMYATVSGDCILNALERSVSAGLGGCFLDEHGLKIAYDPHKEVGHRIVFALVQDASGNLKQVEPGNKYKICINDYSFGGGEGYDFKSASDVVKAPERLSQIFTTYLQSHHSIVPLTPNRIVPVQENLLSVADSGKQKTLHIKSTVPNAKVVVVAGTEKGVGTIEAAGSTGLSIPAPIENPRIVLHGKAGEDGSCDLTVSPEFVLSRLNAGSKNTVTHVYVSVVAQPPHATSLKQTQISYPVELF